MAAPAERRHFREDARALDPLLGEEDTSFLYRQALESEPTTLEQLRTMAGCLAGLTPFALAFAYLRFGPPRTGFLAALALSILLGWLYWWLHGSLRTLLAGRMHELEPTTPADGPGTSLDSWDLEESGPPYYHCGVPMRDVIVMQYLLSARHHPERPWLAASIATLAVPSILAGWIHGPGASWILLAAAHLLAARELARRWPAIVFAERVESQIEAPARLIATHHKLTRHLPGGSGRAGRSRHRNWQVWLALGWITLVIWGIVVLGSRSRPSTWLGAATVTAHATFAIWLRRTDRFDPAAIRERQRTWLDFHSRILLVSHAIWDDDSEDTRRWAHWLLSPHRHPDAHCPQDDPGGEIQAGRTDPSST